LQLILGGTARESLSPNSDCSSLGGRLVFRGSDFPENSLALLP